MSNFKAIIVKLLFLNIHSVLILLLIKIILHYYGKFQMIIVILIYQKFIFLGNFLIRLKVKKRQVFMILIILGFKLH